MDLILKCHPDECQGKNLTVIRLLCHNGRLRNHVHVFVLPNFRYESKQFTITLAYQHQHSGSPEFLKLVGIYLKILITNDDGVNSLGLWALAKEMASLGQLYVVAPDRDQSGVGTSLTLRAPIRATPISPLINNINVVETYAVEGTPADSCVLGIEKLAGRVDLVISGINIGSNLGEDVLVSGTVGAALQGFVREIHSIAISVDSEQNPIFNVAAKITRLVVMQLLRKPSPQPFFFNINVPNVPVEKIEDVEITGLGLKTGSEIVEEGKDSRRKYYWISRARAVNQKQKKGTDQWAVNHNRISITPLHVNLTALDQIKSLKKQQKELLSKLLIH